MKRGFVRLFLLFVLIVGGVMVLMNGAGVSPESAVRQSALRAFGPAGLPAMGEGELMEMGEGPTIEAAGPTMVDLADVPAGVYDPNNQYDRWLNGEIDLDQENLVSRAEIIALQEEARNLAPDDDIQVLGQVPGASAPTAGVAFDSIDYTECCGGGGNVPPDPELAVGPDHVIAAVNASFEIYNKTGTSLMGPTTFASFMSGDANCVGVFDPNALYDEEHDRFILAIDAGGDFYCVAVSQTGNPLGLWNLYSFATGPTAEFFDYPHAGIGRDALYMGANIFLDAGGFSGGRLYAFDKTAMYANLAASAVSFNLGASRDTPQALNLHGWDQGTWPASGPHYFLAEQFNGANYYLFSWTDPFGTNTVAAMGNINLNTATGVTAGAPLDVPQAGGGGDVQGNDWRPQDFEFRNGFGWTVMTISCNPGTGVVNCVRWAQLTLTNPPTLGPAGAGVFASNGEYRVFGDLAVNHCNDMAVGYSKSSTAMFPAVWYTGRLNTDPAGTVQTEAELKAGEITYTSFEGTAPRRWGDYTGMTIDPDGETFWYLGEYSKDTGTTNGRWGTYIGSFSYPTCVPTAVGWQGASAASQVATTSSLATGLGLGALVLVSLVALVRFYRQRVA